MDADILELARPVSAAPLCRRLQFTEAPVYSKWNSSNFGAESDTVNSPDEWENNPNFLSSGATTTMRTTSGRRASEIHHVSSSSDLDSKSLNGESVELTGAVHLHVELAQAWATVNQDSGVQKAVGVVGASRSAARSSVEILSTGHTHTCCR